MLGRTNAVSGKPTQTKTVEFNPGSANNITITPDQGYLLSAVEVGKPMTMIPENIKKDVNIGGVIGTHEGGITIQPVTNLTLSDDRVLSWNSPDISELTNKGYTVTLGYDVYINNELKLNTTTTSVSIVEHLIEGENTIKVIAKAEVKYFESDGHEIVETIVPSEPTVITLSVTLPKAIDGTNAVAIDNKVYVFGGNSGFSALNKIFKFDPTTNTVTTLSATLPKEVKYASAVAINNKAYVFGGANLNTIFTFDPTTNRVTTLSTKLSTAINSTSAVAINNKGYVFGGGTTGGDVFNTILELDPTANTVTTLSTTLPKAIHSTSAVAIDNKAYIFGGADDNNFLNTILEFDPTTNTITTLSATLPQAINSTSAVAINNKGYVFGGAISGNHLNTILKFDPITNTVTTLSATLPIATFRTSAVAIDNKAYIFGGADSTGRSKNTILRVDNLG